MNRLLPYIILLIVAAEPTISYYHLEKKNGVITVDGGGHFMVIEQADEVIDEPNKLL